MMKQIFAMFAFISCLASVAMTHAQEASTEDTDSLDITIPASIPLTPAYIALFDSREGFETGTPLIVKPVSQTEGWQASFENLPVGKYAFIVLNRNHQVISRISTQKSQSVRVRMREDAYDRPAYVWENLDFTLYEGHTVKNLKKDHIAPFPSSHLWQDNRDILLMAASNRTAAQ